MSEPTPALIASLDKLRLRSRSTLALARKSLRETLRLASGDPFLHSLLLELAADTQRLYNIASRVELSTSALVRNTKERVIPKTYG